MKLLAAFDSMYREMIALAGHCEIGPLVHVRRFSNSSPRSITQIQHAFIIRPSIEQWMRSLVGVVVMFENGIYVVSLEQWYPMFSVLETCSHSAADCLERSMRRIS